MLRGRLGAIIGILAVLSLGFPPVEAQVPSTPDLYRMTVEASPARKDITVSKGSQEFTFVVGVECLTGAGSYGACTGSQGDQVIDVTLGFPSPASIPRGWAVSFSPDAGTFSMRAKETRAIKATLRLLSDEPAKDEAVVTLSATGHITSPGGGLLDPITGATGQSDVPGDSAKVTSRKVITSGEKITNALRTYMWPLLGGAVVVLAAAVVLRERRNHRGPQAGMEPPLRVESDQRLQPASPGRGASFPIRIQNETRQPETVALSVVNLPPGWVSILPLTELELEPGERTELWVTIRTPPEARAARVPFEFRARSHSGAGEARLPLEVEVTPAPEQQGSWAEVPKPPPVEPETKEESPRRPSGRRSK